MRGSMSGQRMPTQPDPKGSVATIFAQVTSLSHQHTIRAIIRRRGGGLACADRAGTIGRTGDTYAHVPYVHPAPMLSPLLAWRMASSRWEGQRSATRAVTCARASAPPLAG